MFTRTSGWDTCLYVYYVHASEYSASLPPLWVFHRCWVKRPWTQSKHSPWQCWQFVQPCAGLQSQSAGLPGQKQGERVGRDGAGLQAVSELTGVDARKWVWVLWESKRCFQLLSVSPALCHGFDRNSENKLTPCWYISYMASNSLQSWGWPWTWDAPASVSQVTHAPLYSVWPLLFKHHRFLSCLLSILTKSDHEYYFKEFSTSASTLPFLNLHSMRILGQVSGQELDYTP